MLNKALYFASQLPNQEYRIVAIVTDKKGKTLSIGANSYEKTHPRMAYYARKTGNEHKIFLHAELDALIKCRGKAYNIYVARTNKSGQPCNSKPCEVCEMAIKDFGIKKVYHT